MPSSGGSHSRSQSEEDAGDFALAASRTRTEEAAAATDLSARLDLGDIHNMLSVVTTEMGAVVQQEVFVFLHSTIAHQLSDQWSLGVIDPNIRFCCTIGRRVKFVT